MVLCLPRKLILQIFYLHHSQYRPWLFYPPPPQSFPFYQQFYRPLCKYPQLWTYFWTSWPQESFLFERLPFWGLRSRFRMDALDLLFVQLFWKWRSLLDIWLFCFEKRYQCVCMNANMITQTENSNKQRLLYLSKRAHTPFCFSRRKNIIHGF